MVNEVNRPQAVQDIKVHQVVRENLSPRASKALKAAVHGRVMLHRGSVRDTVVLRAKDQKRRIVDAVPPV